MSSTKQKASPGLAAGSKGAGMGAAARSRASSRDVEPSEAELDALIDGFEARADKLHANLDQLLKRLSV